MKSTLVAAAPLAGPAIYELHPTDEELLALGDGDMAKGCERLRAFCRMISESTEKKEAMHKAQRESWARQDKD